MIVRFSSFFFVGTCTYLLDIGSWQIFGHTINLLIHHISHAQACPCCLQLCNSIIFRHVIRLGDIFPMNSFQGPQYCIETTLFHTADRAKIKCQAIVSLVFPLSISSMPVTHSLTSTVLAPARSIRAKNLRRLSNNTVCVVALLSTSGKAVSLKKDL